MRGGQELRDQSAHLAAAIIAILPAALFHLLAGQREHCRKAYDKWLRPMGASLPSKALAIARKSGQWEEVA